MSFYDDDYDDYEEECEDCPGGKKSQKQKKPGLIATFFQKRKLKKQHPDLKDLMDEEKSWADKEIKARKTELLTSPQTDRKTIQREIDQIFKEHKDRMNRLDKELMQRAMSDDESWDGELI